MKIKPICNICLICAVIFLVSCSSTRLLNIENNQFSTAGSVSLSQIKQAIRRACIKVGWRVKSSNNRRIVASYSFKRDKYGATVGINYNRNSYSIKYINSRNLKYKSVSKNNQNVSDGESFLNDSKEFLDENNPFKRQETQSQSLTKTTIHKRYNQWVRALDSAINEELNNIGAQRVASASPAPNISRSVSKKGSFNCDNQAYEVAYGSASINKSSVNIRSGANTACSIVGSVNRSETFTLVGRQNNWYYISLNDGSNAWVYAPLVKIKADNSISTASKPPIPAAPLPPAKNISIAVINFKTLNKKAQEISLGSLVSETFTTALVNSRGFKIIERDQLDKVVKEIEMNQTGFIETTDAVQVGKMLHADAIITGSVALLNNQIQLNARIIEIESAYVISAETRTATYNLKNITRITNEIVQKLSNKLRNNR